MLFFNWLEMRVMFKLFEVGKGESDLKKKAYQSKPKDLNALTQSLMYLKLLNIVLF